MTAREDRNDRVDEAVSRILDRTELEEVPADLKANVLHAIGSRPEPAARPGWMESLRAALRRPFLAQLYPFAAGAAVGMVALAVLSGGVGRHGVGDSTVEGVMAPPAPSDVGTGAGARVDDQRFELGRANIRFEVFRSGDRAAVSVSADAAEPVLVTIQADPGMVRVDRVLTVPSGPGGAEYGAGSVRIRQSGRDRAEIGLTLVRGGDAPIRIGITGPGGAVQGQLRTTRVPGASAGGGS